MKKILFLLILMFLFGCTNEVDTGKIKIVTTIKPLYDFASSVGGDKVEVHQLLPAGADPHSWEPKPSDIKKIVESDLFVYIGSGFEPGIDSILEMAEVYVLQMSKSEEHDLHVWLDFEKDSEIVVDMTGILAVLSPENKDYFAQNALVYLEKLESLDNQYKEGLKDCKHDSFVVGGHSAFGHLAEAYGLEQIAVSGLSPDAEPSSKKIIKTIEMIKQNDINYIIFEEITSPKLAEVISEESGAEILVLNPGVSTSMSFIEQMESNLEILKIALECRI